MKISIQIQSDSGSHALTATLSDSSSAKAFYELLQKGSLTVRLSEYGGFEKVGSLGRSLARNDRQTATKPGDIMLYQGNQITIFYGNNSWSYSSLGKIDGATQSGLKKVLGRGDVTATFSITGINYRRQQDEKEISIADSNPHVCGIRSFCKRQSQSGKL